MNRVARKNVRVLLAAAPEIVRRLRETPITGAALRAEYGCGHALLKRAILSQGVTPKEFGALMLKRVSHPGGTSSSFRKGHATWNAGKKGWCPPGSEATWFKPGEIRGASARKWRPVGSIILRRGKRLSGQERARRRQSERWIKVRDDGPSQKRYVRLARYLWEKEHGPVPPGCFVSHADNDLLNDDPDNLILIHSRREHCLRLYQRPEVIAKCRAKAGGAAKRRHARNRAAKKWAKGQKRQVRKVWACRACEAEVPRGSEKCPKCGSFAIEERHIEPLPESMIREGMERQMEIMQYG